MPKLLPNTLLSRTFLLLALLVVLTTSSLLGLFRYYDAEPRARETGQLASSAVNLIRAAIFAAAPDKRPALFAELTTREGIRLLPAEAHDEVVPLPDNRYFRLVLAELQARLGPETRIAAAVDGVEGFWVSFRLADNDDEEFWLILPAKRAVRDFAGQWLLWALLAFLLALAVAALIASRLSRPLRRMARSAVLLGRGERPEPLPEEGPDELHELAAAFNRMADDLKRHENDRAEVLAGISHDLRTPLTRLRLEAEISISDDLAREGIVGDIEQMDAVLSQFMDYARGDQGETPVATDLNALLQGVAAAKNARETRLTVQLDDLPLRVVRPRALSRAVGNLLDNARKYGGGSIWFSAMQIDTAVAIRVEDDGPGIPPDQAERLKRPFTRLENARSDATGTGLGLAIVERVARLHGGELRLEERPGGGLRATLWLPD